MRSRQFQRAELWPQIDNHHTLKDFVCTIFSFPQSHLLKCQKHFIKMLKNVRMTMLKSTGTRCSICRQTSDDGMRNKEQHEGKDKGWACNNLTP